MRSATTYDDLIQWCREKIMTGNRGTLCRMGGNGSQMIEGRQRSRFACRRFFAVLNAEELASSRLWWLLSIRRMVKQGVSNSRSTFPWDASSTSLSKRFSPAVIRWTVSSISILPRPVTIARHFELLQIFLFDYGYQNC